MKSKYKIIIIALIGFFIIPIILFMYVTWNFNIIQEMSTWKNEDRIIYLSFSGLVSYTMVMLYSFYNDMD